MYASVLLLFKVSLNKVAVRDYRYIKQITTATSTTTVGDAESWGEYVTVARQISTSSKRRPNNDYGISRPFAFAVNY